MKKYSKFKNTNIEWIGEIPEHWDIIRFKYIVSSQKGKVPKKLTDKNVSNSPVYLSMSYLRGNPDEKKFVLESKDCVHVKTGDILLLWDGSEAGEFIKGKEGVLSSTMSKLDIDDDLNQSYIWYFLKTFEKILKDFTNGMGIPHVDSSILENSKIILPPLSEQIQISSYLNNKTSLIDKLINNNKKLIKLLEEKRTALINKVITKGLDPNVKMKDSGIEWIGEIPEHWVIKQLRYVSSQISAGGTPSTKVEKYWNQNDYVWLPSGRVQNKEIVITNKEKYISQSGLENSSTKLIDPNTTLIALTGATCGNIGYLTFKACANQSVVSINNNETFDSKFLFYYLLSQREQIRLKQSGGAQGGINTEDVKSLKFVSPSIEEQIQISSYLDNKTSLIDKAIIKAKEENLMLKEYRQSLISNVITGKIDVRNN